MIMNMRKAIILIALGGLIGISVVQANPEDRFQEANQAFQKEHYGKSILLYEGLMKEGYHSAALLYNLGLACLEQGQLGKAVLYMERALLLKPNDRDIQHNLKLIKTQYLEDQLDVIPKSFLVRWWENVYQRFSSSTWSILALLFMWPAMAGLSLWRIGKTRSLRKWGFFTGLALFFMSLLLSSLAYSRFTYEYHNGGAVIMAGAAEMRVAPDADSELLHELHQGTSLKVKDELSSWFKVRLSDGRIGWIEKEKVRLL